MELEIDEDNLNYVNTTCHYEHLTEFAILDTNISYNHFFENYLKWNIPCIIRDISKKWNCSRLWVDNNLPNFSYLRSQYKNCSVSIYDCEKRYFNSQKTYTSTFGKYLEYWEQHIKNNSTKQKALHYLKDWHLKLQNPQDDYYEVPWYFASDWLNEYFLENLTDDFRFVYMGPKDTWTPFHVDVLNSYSWSVNICGSKRWILFQPGEENLLRDRLGNLPYDVTNSETVSYLKNQKCRYFEVIQNPGEAIFVPSGWYHQVSNQQNTISINHNWINGCNLNRTWLSMNEHLRLVKSEIKDCEDMDNFLNHCQVMLQASYGLNFISFYNFVKYIAKKRIKSLQEDSKINLFASHTLGKNHTLYDLKSVIYTVKMFILHEDIKSLNSFKNLDQSPTNLLLEIQTVLETWEKKSKLSM